MIKAILALAIMSAMSDTAPELIEPFKSVEECVVAAARHNRTNPVVKTANPALGVQFICLEVHLPGVI